jgi:hypothetical protein
VATNGRKKDREATGRPPDLRLTWTEEICTFEELLESFAETQREFGL